MVNIFEIVMVDMFNLFVRDYNALRDVMDFQWQEKGMHLGIETIFVPPRQHFLCKPDPIIESDITTNRNSKSKVKVGLYQPV